MRSATVVTWLDAHAGASTATLTLALVAVTIYYAVQNRRMVLEMREARLLTILPKLAIEFHHLGPAVMDVAIQNVGPGPALTIDVELVFVPEDGQEPHRRRYRQNVTIPGEQQRFAPPGDMGGNLDMLPRRYQAIQLVGSMKDASGTAHSVNESYDQLAEWRELLHQAVRHWEPPEPERRFANAIAKALGSDLKTLAKQAERIAQAMQRITPR